MKRFLTALFVIAFAGVGLVALGERDFGPFVITREGEQKVIMRFGVVRDVTTPGFSLRVPGLDTVRTYPSRLLYLNTDPAPIRTKDKEQVDVDNFVVWRIADPKAYQAGFPGGRYRAEMQIAKIVGDDVRELIGQHTLTELVKTAREAIMKAITNESRASLEKDGIEIIEVRINRTELPPNTEASVYARMKAERNRLARKYRAEGKENGRRIRAEADRESRVIVANARRDAEVIRGQGDAKAAHIYGEAYSSQSELFAFVRSLEAYRAGIADKTTLVMSPDSEFFQFLEGWSAPVESSSEASPADEGDQP